ncbi:chromate transporter, chromate ion transporter (CHR) family [Aedoeadaptatus ivorii]|uniref:Chromate transporter, chromate ion transporter (CHR) family n=1 Tax=Aedoeadaptatus ivorii TaxID=54006 RepID=A0A448V359_9FIRM|nr:chromate efflux transporter [Peptoniphilus ivorii]MDQ0508237.1 chromate transporter [Peptoniphilus ivorii]VEJ36225.1 chromate transporter, chromate ion transporter (CHR) family [Peptoniphilus ivorii]
MKAVKWSTFLKDVFICALGSYGGPEAHYGVFSSRLVEQKKYITEEELTEMIGLFALVPGPGSTQTITAVGYYMGGPILALLTFLVWALPAILIMGGVGVFFTHIDGSGDLKPLLTYLPAVAVAFIVYAAVTLSRKVLKTRRDFALFAVMLALSLLLVGRSMWVVPLLLIAGGLAILWEYRKEGAGERIRYRPKWWILAAVVAIALVNEVLRAQVQSPWVMLYTSFYRYGYSVIGGGQIVIPLMIQDLVHSQSAISLADFLSGYAIDQAVPGPLFSFAAFVSARAMEGSDFAFLAGLLGGFGIFLPGILLVFFIFPLWRALRELTRVRHFLEGVSITAASLIAMTAITQIAALPVKIDLYLAVVASAALLFSKKVPAPLIVLGALLAGIIL